MSDKKIICKTCGVEFEFTAGQQEYFATRNLTEPKNCKDCITKKNAARNNGSKFNGPRNNFDNKFENKFTNKDAA